MRLSALALIAAVALGAPLAAEAAPAAAAPSAATTIQSETVQFVAGRCGRHAHWVRGHRTRRGYVRGHCVPNRRHR
ncbi:hypothetical protein [Roseiterribacter gracilis]|uniref:Uncharacterized protein n=1 Tax=Roseiterribacter gracilis TaxID=2812848 RepID=A0A8S8XAI9_9PROT|nr:hypothetical protein TMPK1_03930 [Rhodospirillales bacterium TMPK1]